MPRWTHLFSPERAERYRRLLREIQDARFITRHFLETGEVAEEVDMAGEPGITHTVPASKVFIGAKAAVVAFGTYDNVILHENSPVCAKGAELHHRTCALRLGGKDCTC